jgi:YVTN family beta-propeller protein
MVHQPVHRPGAGNRQYWYGIRTGALRAVVLLVLVSVLSPGSFQGAALHTREAIAAPTHSTTIALTADETRVVAVNREANSVSIIQVKDDNGNDVANKLFEIGVGQEPRCVAIHPTNRAAYVTNAITGTVSVIDLVLGREVQQIKVGTEPRGCALTPDGSLLYVANHTEGTVSILIIPSGNPLTPILDGAVQVGRNPTAIAITDQGPGNVTTVFVTQIFAELNPDFHDPMFDGNGEGRDLGKQGVVHAFPAGNANPAITKITLAPLPDSGFTASRTNFCPKAMNPQPHSLIFCPDPTLPGTDPVNANNPQGVFPNQLLSAVIRGNLLYVTAIGPQPEPPEIFNANVQALVYAVDTVALQEVAVGEKFKNLNVQIAKETAAPPPSLDKTFGNDIVAIDANGAGDTFLIVSRGGNQIFRAQLVNTTTGELNILDASGNQVDCRLETGNLPSGVAMRQDGTLAYANNEADFSVTRLFIAGGACLQTPRTADISSSEPPAPGSFEHAVLVGKLAFFTALGIPDNNLFGTPIRDFIPKQFRGKQSRDAWSSCGSCHPDGLADGVTWIFGTGPRQTIPLDGTFNKFTNMEDQRLLNWSAIRGSNTDFNNNSRGVQGGCGFASVVATGGIDPPAQCNSQNPATPPQLTPANPAIYDHGITQGGSDALDAQTLWIFAAVRALNQPKPSDTAALAPGEAVFAANCASCHGGAKWTKSQIFHRDNPAATMQNGPTLDPGVTRLAPEPAMGPANEFFSFTCNALSINYLEDVGTFDANNPLETRDNAAAGQAFGMNGFNVPSLLSINYHAPYLHRGQAQTLEEVFPLHFLPALGDYISGLPAGDQAALLVFLKSIDATTRHFRSEGDVFRDTVRMQGPCPPPVPMMSSQ